MIGYKIVLKVKNKQNSKIKFNATMIYSMTIENGIPLIYDKQFFLEHNINNIFNKIGAKQYDFGPGTKGFDFRQNIINNYTIKSDNKYLIIDIDKISIINKEINKYVSSISSLYGFLKGSHIEGSEGDLRKSPLLLANQEYYGYRFFHLLKRIKSKKNIKIDKEEFITFDDFLNMSNLRTTFEIFNRDIISIEKSVPLTSDWIEELDSVGFKTKLNIKDIQNFNKTQFTKSDRSRLRTNILNNTSQLKYWDYSDRILEAAHIVDVRYLETDENGFYSSDIVHQDNGILLPGIVHKDFDKYIFTIGLNGELIYSEKVNGKYIDELDKIYHIKSIDFKTMINNQSGMKYYLEKRLKIYNSKNIL